MKTLLTSLLVILISGVSYSQVDTTIWNDLKTITKDYYELSAPVKWREMDMTAYNMEV